MKDTNAIQEELVRRSKEEIGSLIGSVMLLIKDFEKEVKESNNHLPSSHGLYWPVECSNFWNVHVNSKDRKPIFSHKSYGEIFNLLSKSMEYNLLETMVEGKTKKLLNKIDLF